MAFRGSVALGTAPAVGQAGAGGRVVAAESDEIWEPYGWQRNQTRRAVVFDHGAGAGYAAGPLEDTLGKLLTCPWIKTDMGGARTWGSDTSLARHVAAWLYAIDPVKLGAKPDKRIDVGGSMGGLTTVLDVLAHPGDVAAAVIYIPAIDPEWVRTHDPNGSGLNRQAIEALYGVNPVPAAKQAYQRGSEWPASVPLLSFDASDDPFTPSASYDEFYGDLPAGVLTRIPLGAVGHDPTTVSAASILDFLYPRIA